MRIFLALHALLVFALTIRILWRNNLTSAARLAWFIVVLVLPYIGVVAYWLFGEIDLGKDTNSKRRLVLQDLHAFNPKVLGSDRAIEQIPLEYQQGFESAASVNGFKPTVGNYAILMLAADTAKAQMIMDFDNATEQIHVLHYIWLNDNTGTSTAHALIRAARRGVKCRAMADGLGSRTMIKSDLWQQMRKAGVDVQVALPINPIFKTLFFSRIDLRNHRKITIIDGKITYCGSQNCADPEFRVKPKYAPWIDIMLRFEGPVVAQNQMLFASDWLVVSPSTPLSEFLFDTEEKTDGFLAQVFGDGPTERQGSTPQMLTTLISQAEHSLTVSTPYFVPDYSVINALCATAYRGIKVKMIFPK